MTMLSYDGYHTYDTLRVEYERDHRTTVHCKKRFVVFPPTAGMSLTKLSLDGNNSDIPSGDGKIVKLFLQCTLSPGSVPVPFNLVDEIYSRVV
jgi:hypothetical protein